MQVVRGRRIVEQTRRELLASCTIVAEDDKDKELQTRIPNHADLKDYHAERTRRNLMIESCSETRSHMDVKSRLLTRTIDPELDLAAADEPSKI